MKKFGMSKKENECADNALKLIRGDHIPSMKWDNEKERSNLDDLLCLGTADMDYMAPEPILSAIRRATESGFLGYPMIPDEYYKAIEKYLMHIGDWKIDGETSVKTSPGVYLSAWIAFQLLTNPGDKVCILTPVHFCFRQMLRVNGLVPVECPLIRNDGRYEIDYSSLEACLSGGIRMLWMCNPHNPVGRAWTKNELSKIAELCERYDVYILSDDVYNGLAFPGAAYTPVASLDKQISYRTVTCCSTSKVYNTAGLRHSYMIIENPKLSKHASEILNRLNLDYGQNIMGIVSVIAAYNECDSWLANLRETICRNHAFITDRFREYESGVQVARADSTYFAWIDMRSLGLKPQQLAWLLEQEEHLVVENGYELGRGGAGFIRINIAASRENLELGADRLARFINNHRMI